MTIVEMDRTSSTAPLQLVTSFNAMKQEHVSLTTGSVMVMTTVAIIQTSLTAQPISSVDATSLDANPVWLRRVYLVTGLVMAWMIVVMDRTSLTVPLGNVR